MNCHKFIYIAALCLAPFLAKAQVFERKHTFNIELGLPNAFSNKAFKNIMQGLVSVAPYYQLALKNNFIAGAGLRYSYFAINEFKVPTAVSGGVHSGGILLKAGWEKFQNKGFGGKHLEFVKERALAKGFPIRLEVLKNSPAKKLYESFGFKIIDEDKFSYEMELVLND